MSQSPQLSSIRSHASEFNLTFRQFNDAWQFHKGLLDFDVGVEQLSPGSFLGNIIELKISQVKIERHYHNSRLRLEGCSTNYWSFGIPIQPLCLLFDYRYLLEDCYLF